MIEKLNIELSVLLKNRLTLNQYFILYCIVKKELKTLYDYMTVCGIDSNDFNKLIERGLIFNIDHRDEIVLESLIPTQQVYFILGYSKDTEWFEEFWLNYPRQTPTGRMLKQISKVKAKKKYLKYVSTEEQHKHILSLLRKEIFHRASTGRINYMQNLETWLNNESWKAYEEDINTEVVNQPEIE